MTYSFFKAVRNDIDCELATLTTLAIKQSIPIRIPRLSNIDAPFGKADLFFWLAAMSGWLLWPVLGLLFFLIKFIVKSYKHLRLKHSAEAIPLKGNVAIGLQRRVLDLSDNIPQKFKPDIVITFSKYSLINEIQIPKVDFEQLTNLTDLILVLTEAIYIHYRVVFGGLKPSEWLYSYLAFDWLLFKRVFERELKQVDSLIYANTHEIWASLLDNMNVKTKRLMLQHGMLPDNYSLKQRINSCDIFFYIRDKDPSIMEKGMLSEHAKVKFIKQSSSLKLERDSLCNASLKTVLVILSVPPYEGYISFIESIADLPLNIIIKPHPTYPKTQKVFKGNSRVIIWDKPNAFPDCNVVVSAISSLSLEYKEAGKAVYMFSDYTQESLVNICRELID